MSDVNEKILEFDFFQEFRTWINFNMESLTWQGRYTKEFEEFWGYFFNEGITVKEVVNRFDYSSKIVKVGPLVSWFTWLQKKFLCYTYVKFDCTVWELSKAVDIPISRLAFILREFFVEKYPYLEDYFSEKFQISNLLSPHIHLKISQIQKEVTLKDLDTGSVEDEVLPSMEVTLYEEWIRLLGRIKDDFTNSESSLKEQTFRMGLKRSFRVFRDVVVMVGIAALLIWLVQSANRYYENYLLDKISVYEPQLKWLNKNLTFKELPDEEEEVLSQVEYDIEEAKPEKLTAEEEAQQVEQVFQPESEVMVTSWDSLPRDINTASFEQSEYEEKQSQGYRSYRYGRNKVFRVLLKTTDFINSRYKLNILSEKYKVQQVDNVKPGKQVPGGAYYNLYVPREYLNEFLAQVMKQDQGVLYESKTRTKRNPPGKNKVFIWLKNI